MCGINGIISFLPNKKLGYQLKLMNEQIIHRGPDETGLYVNRTNEVGMAMTRLSIIDLKTGSQPIYNEDQSLVIVLNGEIYNFLNLRHHLKEKGIIFKTTSDTEVVIKLYELYGTDSFALLDGMFSFSIYDKRQNKVYIARDFFGEKPLYFSPQKNNFIWSSELKSLIKIIDQKPKISKNGLNLFLRLTYIPAPHTIYENIHKLEANSFLEYNINTHSYQIVPIHKPKKLPKLDIDFTTAKQQVFDLVNESVQSRSIADVPIGTFLSGGVDSSIVSWVLAQQSNQPINTFSIGFKKKSFDETDKSRVVANLIGSKHHEFIIDEFDLSGDLDKILLNFDEPFADSSALPTFLVAQKTAKYLKVALTGDGGDEVFGGYNKYYMGRINQRYTKLIPEFLHFGLKKTFKTLFSLKEDNRGLNFKIHKLLNAIDYHDDFYWQIISLGFPNDLLQQILLPHLRGKNVFAHYKQKVSKVTSLSDFRKVDKLVSLEGDLLVKVDRTGMLNSLETRAPFLNRKLWNFTLQLPENYLIKGTNKKYILKKAFEKYFPVGFLNKSKKGFGVPVGDWLRSSLKEELLSFIEPGFLRQQQIFEVEALSKIVNEHIKAKKDYTFQVWAIYSFQKWYVKQNL